MSWSNQQEAAIKAVRAWLRDKNGLPIFRLFGFAGTGKTTLAMELARTVKGTALFACFSGKAAMVMRNKGCHEASTIHSLIYKAIQDEDSGEVTFILNPDSPLSTASLLIVDEASQVNKELAMDIMSFGVKILVLGDPFQLPPVSGEGFFIDAKPNVMLTEIHRQAADNPIIRMSMDIRAGKELARGTYGESRVLARSDIDRDKMRELVLGADQMLCGMNKTRQAFNARYRQIKGHTNPNPVIGDRLVCLKNDHEKGLLNGGLWEAKDITQHADHTEMRVLSLDDVGAFKAVDVNVKNEFWTGREKSLDWRALRGFEQFTFGYCLTCHKSQGSSWPNVVVFDESKVFRQDASKHLYTAITRASDRVTVVI